MLVFADELPCTVPMLMSDGRNWAEFSLTFREAVEAKRLWGHFDGNTPKPTPASDAVTDAEKKAVSQWDRDERLAKSLLTQVLPDLMLL